jgi:hypothetical protein
VTLDANAGEPTYLAMAVDSAQNRVGVAYFVPTGMMTMMNTPDYALRYVEWRNGTVSAVETIRGSGMGTAGPVQQPIGVALAFHPTTGEPSVAFRGGPPQFRPGDTIFWFQSDAVLATRANGTWTQVTVATSGSDANCGSVVSDRGFLVGLWPGLVFTPSGNAVMSWRDGHDGQFEQQDWQGSDVEAAEGPTQGPFTLRCLKAGGDDKQAWGARIQMALGNGQPALVYDQARSGADTIGQNIVFQRRLPNGSWTSPNIVFSFTNVQTGGSLAWDATEGYGIAALDRATNQLKYRKSTDGMAWQEDNVYGLGSGGWYPSLAIDPMNHEPAIAFYYCSARNGIAEGSCPMAEDELRITQRIAGNWREEVVDTEGGYLPRLSFFASGKRVMAYRDLRSGAVKLAVER